MKNVNEFKNVPDAHRNRLSILPMAAMVLLPLIDNTATAETQVPVNDSTEINKETDTATAKKSAPGVTTLPAMTVSGERDTTDPYYPSYVMPNANSGTKTDTPIMETPMNVQVITKEVLKDQQVINIGDALKNVSGVTFNTSGNGNTAAGGSNQTVFLRGFASENYFRNGFRLQQGNGQAPTRDLEMSNVEAVEVLKGPAAILYGLVEPGGMVNIKTKQPLATPYYSLNQQIGSYNLYRTTLDATGPLTKDDSLLYRMNLSYQNSGSFREFANKKDVFVAPIVRWNITPKTQATFEMEYNRRSIGLDTGYVPLYNGRLVDMPRSRNYGEPSRGLTETFFGGFNWSHEFNDDWSIKHQFSVNQQRDEKPYIVAATGQPTDTTVSRFLSSFNSQSNIYGTSIDLTGHFNTSSWLQHTLLVGGDYYRVNTTLSQSLALDPVTFVNLSAIDRLDPAHPGTAFNGPIQPFVAQSYQFDQFGAYIQDQIKLPYGFNVMGGVRYQNLHQDNTTRFGSAVGGGGFNNTPSNDAVTPRVGVLWQAQKWLSLYANYTESFGANTGTTFSGKDIAPTSAEQYEGGIKTELFDGRLRATVAYYDLTKTNVATRDPNPLHAGFSIAAGAVRSRGPEVDIQGEILPGWNLIGTYANTDVRVVKSNDLGGVFTVGNRYYNVPRNSGSLWSTYEFQNGVLKGLKFGSGVTLRDGQLACCDAPAANLPGYVTLDLLGAYSMNVGKYKLTTQLNVTNLLNKHYFTGLGTQGNGLAGYQQANVDFGTPRTFLGSIKLEY